MSTVISTERTEDSYIQKCINIIIHLAETQEKNPG